MTKTQDTPTCFCMARILGRLWLVLVAGLMCLPATVSAQVDYSDLGIDDASQVPRFIAQLQKAVAAGDKAAVAGLVSYPLDVSIAGQDVEIGDAAAFVARYDQIMTKDRQAGILAQSLKFEDIFVNRQGVMIGGNGDVWAVPDGNVLRIAVIREP